MQDTDWICFRNPFTYFSVMKFITSSQKPELSIYETHPQRRLHEAPTSLCHPDCDPPRPTLQPQTTDL